MNITFKDKKLGKIAHDENKLKAKYGKVRGKKIKRRIDALRIADTLEDVRHIQGNFHELIGDRKGEWACDLDQPYRLIFVPHEDPIPTDEHGRYIFRNQRRENHRNHRLSLNTKDYVSFNK